MSEGTDFDAPVGGGALRGTSNGAGEPVLLLHGGPGLSDYTTDLARELGSEYTVHRYHQRGNEPSLTVGPFDIETHISDAVAVLDALGLDKVWLVGHSWGGHLAMFVALRHPDRLLGVLCLDPLGAVGDGGEEDLATNLGARLLPEARAQAEELDRRAMAGEGSAGDAAEGLRLVWPGYFADPPSAPPMPDLTLSVECYAQTFDSIHSHLAARTLETSLPSVTPPFAFLLGAQSPIPPVHGQRTAALIPGATVHELSDCGHMIWMERPGETLEALRGLTGR